MQNQASVRIAGEPNDGNIDQYELISARRALALLKGKLGQERLRELIKEQVAEGNQLFRDHVKRSAGRTETGKITIEATNLSVADFSGWLSRAFTRQDVLIAAQPEHYVMDMVDPNGPHVVETLGDVIVGFYMGGWDQSQVTGENDGVDRRRSTLRLDDDGTVLGSVSTAFLDAPHGMSAELSITLPATSAPDAIEQHLEHFSVEFRSWMLAAAAEKQGGGG
ncbi:hypothetical protein BDY17DRAFT_289676 [Neohortaea acidophila]|uniref:Uncharacterized protein n=1 Tax=Neohortaea acidophila TaxID=245834 RepID=A0A6A6Q667_9PEZI|nr:uncharacterized protein BDY17DRAFT_289676 [Neohortaea acidophila]KAF2487782.1 hypothetical protein BDY17DRAFT_289676 [Neohortaea acidophila]